MSLEFAAVPAAAAASGRQNPMVDSDLPTRMAREEFNIQDLTPGTGREGAAAAGRQTMRRPNPHWPET